MQFTLVAWIPVVRKGMENGILKMKGCRIMEDGKITSLADGANTLIPGPRIGPIVGRDFFLATQILRRKRTYEGGLLMDIFMDRGINF